MREISNLDLKFQLTKEYLESGGVKSIFSKELLDELISVDKNKIETITPRVNAFMLSILGSHMTPPLCGETMISEYESFLQKSHLFDQGKIDTVEQFEEVYSRLKQKKRMLFRGQREAKWRLYSTFQRIWMGEQLSESEEYHQFLNKMIGLGTQYYQSKIVSTFNDIHDDIINDTAVLGFLQHHGTPTPLLDWTYSLENALFFGTDDIEKGTGIKEIDNYFSLYFVDEKSFSQGGMRKVLEDSMKKLGTQLKLAFMKKIAIDKKDFLKMKRHFQNRSFFDMNRVKGSGLIKHMCRIDNIITIPLTYFSDDEPNSNLFFSLSNSLNIKNQKGVFTWNSHPYKPVEVVGKEQYDNIKSNANKNSYAFCGCYNINKSLGPYIQKKLTEDGITKDLIYPDFEINTYHIYDESKKLQ